MRTIKFRGKAHGRWIYGGLVYSDNIEPAIYFEVGNKVYKRIDWAYVDPATVGEFTGLQDANGTDVYEGDILRWRSGNKTYQVVFKDGIFFGEGKGGHGASAHFFPSLEVIGNIHDKQDLREKGGVHE